MLNDVLSLFFPNLCISCSDKLFKNEEFICLNCYTELPRTKFYEDDENPIAKMFWGRLPLANALSVFQFNQDGILQDLIHALKYKGETEVGINLGREIGKDIVKSENWSTPDVIIPVPLHEKKKHQRGYNQAEYIAEGVAEILKVPYDFKSIKRMDYTESQTKKGKFERWENVSQVFEVKKPMVLENKHVLLVDDVVTTGATLEACGAKILEIKGVQLSIAAVANG